MIRGIPVKKPPSYKKPPLIRVRFRLGKSEVSAGGENFGDFDLEMMIFIRKIVLERRKKAKFSACGGLEALKQVKKTI